MGDQFDPKANIIAGLKYISKRYGMTAKWWERPEYKATIERLEHEESQWKAAQPEASPVREDRQEHQEGKDAPGRMEEEGKVMPDDSGLYDKYEVYRIDGKGVGPCVVLEFDDPNTWPALLVWATTVKVEGNHQLANDIRAKVIAHVELRNRKGK
jgi:hypothetical protein